MNIRQKCLKRSGGYCEACGVYAGNELEWHHIWKRNKGALEIIETTCMLCHECHRGSNGVHGKNGFNLDIILKLWSQAMLEKLNYSQSEIRKLVGGKLWTIQDYTNSKENPN